MNSEEWHLKNDVFSSHRTALAKTVVALLVIVLAQNLIAQTGRANIGGTVKTPKARSLLELQSRQRTWTPQ